MHAAQLCHALFEVGQFHFGKIPQGFLVACLVGGGQAQTHLGFLGKYVGNMVEIDPNSEYAQQMVEVNV